MRSRDYVKVIEGALALDIALMLIGCVFGVRGLPLGGSQPAQLGVCFAACLISAQAAPWLVAVINRLRDLVAQRRGHRP